MKITVVAIVKRFYKAFPAARFSLAEIPAGFPKEIST
jgi:hypothetical protein